MSDNFDVCVIENEKCKKMKRLKKLKEKVLVESVWFGGVYDFMWIDGFFEFFMFFKFYFILIVKIVSLVLFEFIYE